MRVTVGFTPAEQVAAPVGIVIDVLRATSTICQALASGWQRVVCVGDIPDARALAGPGVALAGERDNVKIEGFDFGNSPREFTAPPAGETLVLTTTNGTRALVAAAARCETVLVASLLNLDAVVEAVRGDADVAILCAGVEGGFAIDDAYVAGRIVEALGGTWDDSAIGAARLAGALRERRGRDRRRDQRGEHPQRGPRRRHPVLRTRERGRVRASRGRAGRSSVVVSA